MEGGDLGPQLVPPIFIHHHHQTLPSRYRESTSMSKKRDLPWLNHGGFNHQPQLPFNSGHQSAATRAWNPKGYAWDSTAFVARPAAQEVDMLGLREKKGGELPVRAEEGVAEDEEGLTLKLGGSSFSPPSPPLPEEAAAVKPNKRVRSGSPASCGGNFPMCQVDDCRADLSKAKDYHRRHKVCEVHSKTTKALVGKQHQRFCQQCSRFHLLAEFDEGKRSCRRRLAGHNRRRRKTQPQDVSSGLVQATNKENSGGGCDLDVVNLLTALARLQGNDLDKASKVSSLLDRERLVHLLGKINSNPASSDAAVRSSSTGKFDLNLSSNLQSSIELMSQCNGNLSNSSTLDLLAVVSAALTSSSPDTLSNFALGTNKNNSKDVNSNSNCFGKDEELIGNTQKWSVSLSENGKNKGGIPSPGVPEVQTNIPLQLFSSSPEDDSPPKLASSRRYFSSDSSNPMEERSPSSSPPVVRKLFPLHSSEHEKVSVSNDDNIPAEASLFQRWASPAGLFKSANGRAENSSVSNQPYQAGCALSSGSDHSPSSSNSDSQERTGRIIFKLFDKDLSKFPGTLRNQIFRWLSNSPSEMESYIRPGCVILAVYASMPQYAWDEFQDALLRRTSLLIDDPDSDFWSSGRFLVQTDRQLASHKDGKLRICKSWKTWSAPELISISPLAVVGGKETSLVLRGRNLAFPGTRIHCTFMGGYTSKEVSTPSPGAIYDDSCSECFVFPGGFCSKLGRCFIEVENGFKGNSFPLIIAEANVCQELRMLESEFEPDRKMEDISAEDQDQYLGQPRSRENALHFLNELGWLFQRHCSASGRYPLSRLKFLLTYSVERDWTALVRTLLDILFEDREDKYEISEEILVLLSEVQLLSRAVKRKCRKMVDLLLQYTWNYGSDASKTYVFPPNAPVACGMTALHLAASTRDSVEMVDALTNDPQEIGLKCWTSSMDENKKTPYMYALSGNHHSYNILVARKIGDRRNSQVTIPVMDSEISLEQPRISTALSQKVRSQTLQGKSCSQCAIITSRRLHIPGSQGLLHRPYIHSMLAIAAVCVCVCLLLRGLPQIGSVEPFKWENVEYGSS